MDAPAVANGHRQTLSEKYDIGLEKLEPEYINKCQNSKELEKILKILRYCISFTQCKCYTVCHADICMTLGLTLDLTGGTCVRPVQ